MSGIEKITERILADAREQAEANRAEAAGKAKEILAAGDALAEKKSQAILDQAKAEEIELHKRRQAVCDLEMRKDTLRAKRQVMDAVFREAGEALAKISGPEYETLLEKLLIECATVGSGKVAIAKKDQTFFKPAFVKKAEKALEERGIKRRIEIDRADEAIENGFIYYADGMEINCTFAAVLAQERERLETGVYSILFA